MQKNNAASPLRYLNYLPDALALLLFTVPTFLCEDIPLALSLLLAILLHEAGHILAYHLVGIKHPQFSVERLGLRLTPSRPMTFYEQLFVALAGPLCNLLCCFLLWLLFGWSVPAVLHGFTALFNLLPVSTLDGGQILEAALGILCPSHFQYNIMRFCSLSVILLGLLFALGALWLRGQGSYLYFLFFSLFFTHIFGNTHH